MPGPWTKAPASSRLPSGATVPARRRPPWPVIAAIGSVAVAVGLTLALPGGWRHARTVFGDKDDVPALPKPQEEARGLIELQGQGQGAARMSAEVYERYCNRHLMFIKSREVLQAALAEPGVALLETVAASPDSLGLLRESVRAQMAGPGTIAVSMSGERVDDLKAIVDAVMRSYVRLAPAADRREREERIEKLAGIERGMRIEIESMERQIALLSKSVSDSGPQTPEAKARDIQKKMTECRESIGKRGAELADLERRLGVIRLTEESLADLRMSMVPAEVLAKLKPLINRNVPGYRTFARELAGVLTPDEVRQYGGAIVHAAHLPTVQLPQVPAEAIDRDLERDEALIALAKDQVAAQAAYEKTKKTADPKDPELAALHLKLQQTIRDLETKRQAARKQAVVKHQAAEVSFWLTNAESLSKLIVMEGEMLRHYQQDMKLLEKVVSSATASESLLAKMRESLVVERQTLERIRTSLNQLRQESQTDGFPRIRQAAKEQE